MNIFNFALYSYSPRLVLLEATRDFSIDFSPSENLISKEFMYLKASACHNIYI